MKQYRILGTDCTVFGGFCGRRSAEFCSQSSYRRRSNEQTLATILRAPFERPAASRRSSHRLLFHCFPSSCETKVRGMEMPYLPSRSAIDGLIAMSYARGPGPGGKKLPVFNRMLWPLNYRRRCPKPYRLMDFGNQPYSFALTRVMSSLILAVSV